MYLCYKALTCAAQRSRPLLCLCLFLLHLLLQVFSCFSGLPVLLPATFPTPASPSQTTSGELALARLSGSPVAPFPLLDALPQPRQGGSGIPPECATLLPCSRNMPLSCVFSPFLSLCFLCCLTKVGKPSRSKHNTLPSGSLQFRSLSKEDHGEWECVATNIVTSITASTHLTVIGRYGAVRTACWPSWRLGH